MCAVDAEFILVQFRNIDTVKEIFLNKMRLAFQNRLS